ncbi:DUF6415 family natural product biosynthesis protein [Streptomyces sp. NPDC006339]|uniref:DUF6415 family natural product biosynthesis protein n=1 Tax=Streptomyces sp. NPDC006339 TaxID=3156755 RepID=UPI0033B40A79
MTRGIVLHDPTGTLTADIPLDRDRLEELATTVLGWRQTAPEPKGTNDAALQLTGYAQLLIGEVSKALQCLPADHPVRARGAITREEAVRRLPALRRRGGGLVRAQKAAHLIQALHGALDAAHFGSAQRADQGVPELRRYRERALTAGQAWRAHRRE